MQSRLAHGQAREWLGGLGKGLNSCFPHPIFLLLEMQTVTKEQTLKDEMVGWHHRLDGHELE